VKRKCQGVHRRRLGLFRVDNQDVRKQWEGRQEVCRMSQRGFRADQGTSGKKGARQEICRRLQEDLRAVQGRQEGGGRGRSPLKGEVLEVGYGMVVDVADRDEMLKGCIKPG
jgi:hypothetical protein